jgi:hypothetical protein
MENAAAIPDIFLPVGYPVEHRPGISENKRVVMILPFILQKAFYGNNILVEDNAQGLVIFIIIVVGVNYLERI